MPVLRLLKNGNLVNSVVASIDEKVKIEQEILNGERTDIDTVEFPAAKEPIVMEKIWDHNSFRSSMTLAEKAKWDTDSDPSIIVVKNDLNESTSDDEAAELAQFLVDQEVISEATKTAILS